jgi:hypothetical protein
MTNHNQPQHLLDSLQQVLEILSKPSVSFSKDDLLLKMNQAREQLAELIELFESDENLGRF